TTSIGTAANAVTVKTSGLQTYNDAVTIVNNTNFGVSGTTTGDVTFASTVDNVAAAGPFDMAVNTSGTTTFQSQVGNTQPIKTLTTNTGGTTSITGGSIATTGTQAYGDAVTVSFNPGTNLT